MNEQMKKKNELHSSCSPGHSGLLLIHTTILWSQVIFFPVRQQLLTEENRGSKRLDSTKDFFKRKKQKTPKSNT